MFHHSYQYPRAKGASKRVLQNIRVSLSTNQQTNGRLKSISTESSDTLATMKAKKKLQLITHVQYSNTGGKGAIDKAREQNSSGLAVDLSDVPPQPPIPKSDGHIKEGSSKYAGVTYSGGNKWRAQITIDGKQRHIGCYENEEEAAIDYARAVFKYKRAKES